LVRVRPPPHPLLFPYTTLFRSRMHSSRNSSTWRGARPTYFFGSMVCFKASRLKLKAGSAAINSRRLFSLPFSFTFFPASMDRVRSEEHTSELQSRFELVCRLLL